MQQTVAPTIEPGTSPAVATPAPAAPVAVTTFSILAFLGLSHFLNDVIQSLVPSIYPMLKTRLALDFSQIGLITFTFQGCASLLQPLIGLLGDRKPRPWLLPSGMIATLIGLLALSRANNLSHLLVAAGMVGLGSSVFHPEASRVARLASGGRHGLAQSMFQVGGNAGSATGPLLAAFIVLPFGQGSIAWFSLVALLAILLLSRVATWHAANRRPRATRALATAQALPRGRVVLAICVLFMLLMSKFIYTTSLSSYLTFYLIERFDVSVRDAQLILFAYLAAMAVGTLCGGPLGDRIGRKYVIWGSILGVLPFTLALPHVGLTATVVLVVVIGLIISAAFAAIIVYAQELVPGRVGMIAGVFFGLAFGISALGAAALGALADARGIDFVYMVCGFLPAIGLLAVLLPRSPRPANRFRVAATK